MSLPGLVKPDLIGVAQVQTVSIGLGEYCDGPDAHLSQCVGNAYGDFAAIRDEDLADHV